MGTYRKNGIIVGLLFILCTAASIVGPSLTVGLLGAADPLARLIAHRGRVVTGALIELAWAATGVGISLGLYPVIRRHGTGLALGSVIFRTLENVAVVAGTLCMLALLALAPQAAAADVGSVQSVGRALLGAREWAHQVIGGIFFAPGVVMYYVVLYRARLIPRWLSGWGLGGAVLGLGATVAGAFDHGMLTGTINTILHAPIGLQEMVLAVWLIAKDFRPAVERDRGSAAGTAAAAAGA